MKKKTGKKIKIPLAKPYFSQLEEDAITKTLRTGWVAQGPRVAEFEELVRKYVGAEYAVATSSATTALFLSLYLFGIGPGDKVIVPSFSFIATANVTVHVGARPVFVDVDKDTYNINPDKIEEAITKKTKAIIPVDQVGLAADLGRIRAIARKYKLRIIEDAACALGSTYKGRKIGSISEIACLSFHPRKTITTGEGGIILTNSRKWAERLRILRHQGMATSDIKRHQAKKVIHEAYPEVGFNFRMSDIQASIGVEQMKKLPRFLAKRAKIAKRYTQAFGQSDLIVPPYVPKGYGHNWQSYIIRLKRNSRVTRDQLIQRLLDEGIATRRGVMAIHLEPPYKKMYGRIKLPITEKATKETISLPMYPQMTRDEQNYVIEKVRQAVE